MIWTDEIMKWMAIHPVRVDLLVVAVVAGIIAYILKRERRRRRVLHRRIWGMWLKNKDREKYQLMKFEDALTDAAFEMVHSGDMTAQQEKMWYARFASAYNMAGLVPGRPKDTESLKKMSRTRLQFWRRRPKPNIPGDPPGVEVDPTYIDGKFKSKYVR